jgi:uncharacterized protein (DUF849 family)
MSSVAQVRKVLTDVQQSVPAHRRADRESQPAIPCTPEQVLERLEELLAAGANHLLLNPISRHAEQLEAVAELAGLK